MSVSIISLIKRKLFPVVLVALILACTASAGIIIPSSRDSRSPLYNDDYGSFSSSSHSRDRISPIYEGSSDFRIINPISGTTVDCSEDGVIPVEIVYRNVGSEKYTVFLVRPNDSVYWEVSQVQNNSLFDRFNDILLIKYIVVINPGIYDIAIITTDKQLVAGSRFYDIPTYQVVSIISVTVPPPSKTDIHIISPINGTVIESIETKTIPVEIYYNSIGPENITAILINSYEANTYKVADITYNIPTYKPKFYSAYIPIPESGTYNIIVITTNMQLKVGDTFDIIPTYESIDKVTITSLAYPHALSLFLRKEVLYIIVLILIGFSGGVVLFRLISNYMEKNREKNADKIGENYENNNDETNRRVKNG